MTNEFDALRKLESEVPRRVREIVSGSQFPVSHSAPAAGKLFHYTTSDGLKGIGENRELWATSAYFLNDSSEIAYGWGVLVQALKEWIDRKPPKTSLRVAQLIHDETERFLSRRELNEFQHIYLACFCEEDNLLSQWRAYGQAGGYSLGFEIASEGPCRALMPEAPEQYTAHCVKVEYERDRQIERCRAILNQLLAICDEFEIAELFSSVCQQKNFQRDGLSALAGPIWEVLQDAIVAFKNRAFNVEKEWRVVVRRRTPSERNHHFGNYRKYEHLRSLRGILTPYVKLIPADKYLPICSVRSGPTLDKNTAKEAIVLLLSDNVAELHKVKVEGADIPVRF